MLHDISSNNPSHLLIVGDFNCRPINWGQFYFTENGKHVSSMLLECIRDCFLFQHVKDSTRYRDQNIPSILDLILTSEENMIITNLVSVKVTI